MSAAKIRFENVSKEFTVRADDGGAAKRFVAVHDVTLDVKPGEFLVLVGPSGCGKSTLLDLLAGLALPTSGRVLIDGQPITGPARDRGVVFQQYALFPWLTALDNVAFGLEVAGVGKRARREKAAHYLELVGLTDFANRFPHELSGGMKQRVAIARSLAYEPQVLLMDEPLPRWMHRRVKRCRKNWSRSGNARARRLCLSLMALMKRWCWASAWPS
jgi:NitT/TauT family transport system ATP-binding protein